MYGLTSARTARPSRAKGFFSSSRGYIHTVLPSSAFFRGETLITMKGRFGFAHHVNHTTHLCDRQTVLTPFTRTHPAECRKWSCKGVVSTGFMWSIPLILLVADGGLVGRKMENWKMTQGSVRRHFSLRRRVARSLAV